jgi:hypothetical protein
MRVVLIALVVSLFGYAQEFRATLAGRITDPAGASVSDAKIEVKNTGNGQLSATNSGADGSYSVAFLTPGDYVITVEKAGFSKVVREGVHLDVAQRAVVDVQLALGEVNQSVTVSAGAELLETESADRGLVIESNRVLNTALQGRNIMAQAWSAPGVIENASATRLRPFDIAGSSSITVNGGRPSTNEILVDGVTSLYQASSASYIPTAEATGEFKVQNTNFDAQYGWTLGAVINIITKNGTNEFHGSLFEFLQNTHLNANTFNSNRSGVRRSSSHINTFGGDIGGPIIKNKLFFTYTFEEIRQVIPDPFTTSVPTALQRQGDFSQTYYSRDSAGNPLVQTIYDPFSTVTGSSGSLVRTAFPNNVIPNSRLNPVALKALSYVPGGNVPGDPTTGLNNLTNNGSTRKFTDFFPEHTARVDYDINQSTRLFVRYSRNALQEARAFHYSTTSTLNPADTTNNNPFTRENHNATVQLTKVISPTLVFNFRLGLERFKSEQGNGQGAAVGPATLGFSQLFVSQANNYFPKFNWSNYEGAGAQPTYIGALAQTNSLQTSLAKTWGSHNLKFGGDFRLLRGYSPNPGYNAGNFTFDQTFTGGNPLQIQPSSGNALASFLLGVPQSGFIQVNSQPARQENLSSVYFQDDIRVTNRLKVNAGLRWDYLGPLTDRFNELARGFDPNVASPLQVPGLSLHGGLLFTGVGGQPRGIFDSNWHNFGPRAGAAYQLDRHTVLRGGYALVYGQTWNDPGNAPGFSQTTNMVTSIQTGIPYNTLDNPFPGGVLQPVGSSLGLLTAVGQTLQFADPAGGSPPYVHQFSFEVQRELPGDFLVSGAYVGSRSRRIQVSQQLNALPLSAFQLGSAALTQNVPNPMAGLVPGTALNGATIQRQQLLAPFPQFLVSTATNGSGGILEMFRPLGTSSYNALQLLVTKRLSYGLNFSVAYTWSKQIDQVNYANAQDTRLEKVVASWDVPQSLQINMVYDLPFGTGKKFGAGLPSPVRYAISGWSFSSLTRLNQGMPMTFPTNAAPTGVNPALSDPNYTQWFNTCTVLANGTTRGCVGNDQAAWTIRQPYTLQTWSSRLSSVRVPGIHNSDISVMKRNRITERLDMILRADFINAFNSPQFFSGPVIDVNSGNFGRISGAMDQSNLPRFIQLSLKLQF